MMTQVSSCDVHYTNRYLCLYWYCACYVLCTSHYCYRCVTLYTLHITVLQRWKQIYSWSRVALQNRVCARPGRVSEWRVLFINKIYNISCQKNCMKTFHVCCMCIICSELFWGFTHAQKANVTFSDVSVWMRHFWKTLVWTESVLKWKRRFQMYPD